MTPIAAAADEPQIPTEEEAKPDKNHSFAVLPGAFYSQETSVGFAALASYTFELENTGASTWPSTVTTTAVYTLNNQVSFSTWVSVYLGEANDWAIESEAFVEHFPTNYYGLGPRSESSYQVFTRRQFRSDLTLRRRVHGSLFLGIADHLAFLEVADVQAPVSDKGPTVWTADDQLGSGNVTGEDGTRIHGVGALVRWDTRDNNQSTRQGALLDLELAGYGRSVGSTQNFGYTRLDVRGFVPVGKGTVAGQWFTEVGVGDTPFTSLTELGGDNLLRGMYQGRYRDLSVSAAQVELRYPIFWRFSAAGFAGAGHVFPSIAEVAANTPRWTAGGGLRIEIDEKSHSTIRLDMGSGPDGTGFMITFGEAF